MSVDSAGKVVGELKVPPVPSAATRSPGHGHGVPEIRTVEM